MSAKALYTDLSTKIISELLLAQDYVKLWYLQIDRDEYVRYSSGWQAVNLDDFISQFDLHNDNYNYTGFDKNGRKMYRKISFFDDG